MKKLIILILTVVLCSCCTLEIPSPDKKTMQQTENFRGDISEVEYKGHSYIIFEHASYTVEGIGLGVIHDPDCYCTK